MARNRKAKYRSRTKKNGLVDVDITSLLDILTILMVFLLQSYNSSGVVINIPPGIVLPKSTTESVNTFGVNIQVSSDKIWVEDQEILDSATVNPKTQYDHGGRRILPLYDELVKIKEKIKLAEKASANVKKFSGVANLVIDKSLKYTYIKKIMYTCAEAGFKEFKFVVLNEAI